MAELGKRPTIRDVARAAKVDPAVVSRVLRNDPRLNVRDSTRARVLKVVDEMGYQPNAIARSLRTASSGAFGLLIPNFQNPVYAAVIEGAEAEAIARGGVLLTATAGTRRGDVPAYVEMARQGRVDGILLAGSDPEPQSLAELDRLRVPWLRVNRRTHGAARYVVLDDAAAASLAVQHLIDLGHRDIAHLAGPADVDTAIRRKDGWRRSLRAAGLPARPSAVVETDYTTPSGAHAIKELLSHSRRPSAVFVANGAAAIGALYGLTQAGLRVPEDISVVTIDDQPLFEFLSPPLTAVRMPLAAMGARGIELLATQPADRAVEEVISQPMELVERASTAPAR